MYEENLSLQDADEEQIQLINELKNVNKGRIPVEKRYFVNHAWLYLSVREKSF